MKRTLIISLITIVNAVAGLAQASDSYMAFESEEIGSDYYREKYTVQRARKSKT